MSGNADSLFAGALAGTAQIATGHPFDTIKVWNVKYRQTMLQSSRQLYRRGGLKQFYRGAVPPLINSMAANMAIYYTYAYFRDQHQLTPFQAGMVSGAAVTLLESPSDMIKTHLQTTSTRGVAAAVRELRFDVFRGFSGTMIRNIPSVGLYFWGYTLTKRQFENPYLGGFIGGGVAGFLCWAPTYPLDYLKTRQQTSRQKLRDIIRVTRPREYFIGMVPCVARAIIINPFIFLAYELGLGMYPLIFFRFLY